MTKISPHHAVFLGDFTGKHVKPPGSPEAIYAIWKVGSSPDLNGDRFVLWDDAYRQAVYERWHPQPKSEPEPRRCLDCGVITSRRTLCAPCQHVRDRVTVQGRTCQDCGDPVARNHAQVIRCPRCQERVKQEANRLNAERHRARLQETA